LLLIIGKRHIFRIIEVKSAVPSMQEDALENPPPEEAIKFPTFGRRRVAPRVCIADGKRHIRKFLGEALEELGFITCECTQVGELSAVLDGQAPDLVIVGLSTGGIEPVAMLEALAARSFDGKVLLLGPRDSLMLAAVQELGEQRGIAMLPTLATPFDSRSLGNSVAPLIPTEAPPSPVIEAAEALSGDWVELWYQPKFDTNTLELCGAEALIRVRHPTWGIIPPACFLPDKDDPYLSVLSEFVIGRAIADWRNFIQHRAIEISINLPMIFFQDPKSVASLRRQMPDHPAFEGFIIEIDAADVSSNLDLARAAARQLRFSNIGISIDHLGSEWPSVVGLHDFPFVEIKVDRQFIAGCADDRLKRVVCRQILDLADGFGVRTVAEGVKTRADFLTVRDMGFDLVQCVLFAKPMTAQKFALTTLRHSVAMP
jgi:EAL domain-containing protein (putative c-di-GMP-specific phosphodiesterase class I)/CheY-like chemotaxis protein